MNHERIQKIFWKIFFGVIALVIIPSLVFFSYQLAVEIWRMLG